MPPPDLIEIEPTLGCNLRCVICHVSYMDEKVKSLDLNALGTISFVQGRHVIVGSSFEPTIHPKFNQLIELLNRNRNRIELITNGTRISKLDVPAIYDSNLSVVTFSFDGIRRATFEQIRRNTNYEKTMHNILYMWDGSVQLCQQFIVGNLLKRSLEDI